MSKHGSFSALLAPAALPLLPLAGRVPPEVAGFRRALSTLASRAIDEEPAAALVIDAQGPVAGASLTVSRGRRLVGTGEQGHISRPLADRWAAALVGALTTRGLPAADFTMGDGDGYAPLAPGSATVLSFVTSDKPDLPCLTLTLPRQGVAPAALGKALRDTRPAGHALILILLGGPSTQGGDEALAFVRKAFFPSRPAPTGETVQASIGGRSYVCALLDPRPTRAPAVAARTLLVR